MDLLINSASEYINNLIILFIVFFVFWITGQVIVYFFSRTGRFGCVTGNSLDKSLNEHIFIGLIGLVFFLKMSFLFALFSFFNIYSISVVIITMLLTFGFVAKKTTPFRIKSLNAGHYFIFLMAIILGLRSLFLLVGADDISYHLPYARAFLENQNLTIQEHLIYPLHTLDINILYALGLMIDDPYFLKLLNISFICLSGLVIFDYTYKKTNVWYALLVPTILFSLEKIHALSLVVYVDFAFTFFISVGFISFLLWYEKRQTNQADFYLVISALAVVEAASTKYFGLVFGFMLFMFYVFNSQKKVKDSLIFLALCALLGSHWYLRNIYYSGNPVHPFLSNIFGYFIWNENDLALNLTELKSHGGAKSVANYFTEIVRVGLLPTLLMYVSFAVSFYKSKKDSADVLSRGNCLLAGFCILYSVFWYFTAHVDRYLLPVLCLALASFSISLYTLFQQKVMLTVVKYAVLSLVLIQLGVTLKDNTGLIKHYPLSKHNEIMQNRIAGFSLMEKANEMNFPNKRVYQAGFATSIFYYDGIAAGHWMGGARWSGVADVRNWKLILKPAVELKQYLKHHRYDALIVSKEMAIFDRDDLASQFDFSFEDTHGFILIPKG